ncbi:MAG TPA: hypothetical protein VGH85_15475 [Mycobacteriales bacterium]|jgi:hypothetical protein
MTEPFVSIQVGAASFIDEGVAPVLDTLQERGAVNALFLATPTWTRGTGGRQLPGYPIPDHGGQEYDLDWVGGNFATPHPQFYGNTVLGAAGRAPEHPGWDMLEEVLPEARKRGMASYAWMEESGYAQVLRDYPNFPKVLEVDVWGRPTGRPCFNNPDYRNWHLSIVEDYVKSYPLDGLAWCSERPGPLNLLIEGPVTAGDVSCFCRHCRATARERGIDADRALDGYRALTDWNRRAAAGNPSVDGAFVEFWRILLRHPDVLAWQTLWTDSQRQLYRDIYGVAKACRTDIEVGWHLFHDITFNPFYRADQDYAELTRFSDFLKVVVYNNCAGPRFHTWVGRICRALFADADAEQVYPLLMRLLQLDEAPYEDLPSTGFSAEYVRRETARAVTSVASECKIYTGIDIDIPVGKPTVVVDQRGQRAPAGTGLDAEGTFGDDLTQCTPDSVNAAVKAAFSGGASGVVLSRKYSEMSLDNLTGAGDAIREAAK